MNIEKLKHSCQKRLRNLYNIFNDLKKRPPAFIPSDLKELDEIGERSLKRTVINEHLVTLFIESLIINPNVIVELGVGKGHSNFVLERVARLCNSHLVSVDIDDCSKVSSYEKWVFIQKDDIYFAKEFESWCQERNITPKIDVLFIDTSHIYEHTLQEINSYFPLLSERSKVFFHDSNLSELFFRKDGSMEIGWNNDRGVIRALEKYFNRSFNEKESFIGLLDGWLIQHYHYCTGFTVLEKVNFSSKNV
jgi:hypothetical protein